MGIRKGGVCSSVFCWWLGGWAYITSCVLTCSPTICTAPSDSSSVVMSSPTMWGVKAALRTKCHQHRIFLLHNKTSKIWTTYSLSEIMLAARFIVSVFTIPFYYCYFHLFIQIFTSTNYVPGIMWGCGDEQGEETLPKQISNQYAKYCIGGLQMTSWECKGENHSARDCHDVFMFLGVLLSCDFVDAELMSRVEGGGWGVGK